MYSLSFLKMLLTLTVVLTYSSRTISSMDSVETVDTFHRPEDTSGCFPHSPDDSPYFPDEADCNCYYVCTKRHTAARMCCPADLWWNQESHKCLFHRDFSLRKQIICEQNRRRKALPASGEPEEKKEKKAEEDKQVTENDAKEGREENDALGEEIATDAGTFNTVEELSLDRYFSTLPERYIYAFCSLTPDPSLPASSQLLNGTIDFRQSLRGGPTDIRINITGFDPEDSVDFHGAHVHEYGDQSEGCASAGGHYDPFGVVHGGPLDSPQFRHFGDLGNLEENDGRGETLITDYLVSLLGPFSVLGRSFVVHELEDDLGRGNTRDSLISGNAGTRLACCTIGLSKGDRWH